MTASTVTTPRFAEPVAPAPRAVRMTGQHAPPAGAVDVSHTSVWVSRYCIGDTVAGEPVDVDRARELHRKALLEGRLPYSPSRVRRDLAGYDLACECEPDTPCYRDNLLEIANNPTPR